MTIPVDIWLRGDDFATTRSIDDVRRQPRDWTDDDVARVLEGMLSAMHRLKFPDAGVLTVQLRGLSWIVSPADEGGVLIAIEITMGAAIAGPLDAEQPVLEEMIARVIGQARSSPTIH
jgi:hypothetical protein